MDVIEGRVGRTVVNNSIIHGGEREESQVVGVTMSEENCLFHIILTYLLRQLTISDSKLLVAIINHASSFSSRNTSSLTTNNPQETKGLLSDYVQHSLLLLPVG